MTVKIGRGSRPCRVVVLLLLLPATIVGLSSNATMLGPEGRAEAGTEVATEPTEPTEPTKPSTRSGDSYLEALRHSRTSTDPREGVVRTDGAIGTGSFRRRNEQPQGPVYAAKRADAYSPPVRTSENFHGVRNSYGPPQPPRESYGPTYNDYPPYGEYGTAAVYPTSQQQGYGSPSVAYGHGISSIDFSWPFALKLNAFTLAKILLKLVIFKMIVKFIAIVCLLLFVPKLEIKKGNKGSASNDDEDEGRRSIDADSAAWDRLNLLTLLVNDALGRYGNANGSESSDECSTLECRVRGAFDGEKRLPDYENLLRGYLLEETRLVRAKT